MRAAKTMIQNAFLELLENKQLSKITVTEICKRAGVNRSSFYANFSDTEHLLGEIEDEVLTQIPFSVELPISGSEELYRALVQRFFQYVRAHEHTFRILIIQSNKTNFKQKLIAAVIKNHALDNSSPQALLHSYCYLYCVNGIIGLMQEWIGSGFAMSTEQFTQLVLQFSAHTGESLKQGPNG